MREIGSVWGRGALDLVIYELSTGVIFFLVILTCFTIHKSLIDNFINVFLAIS